MTKRSGKKEFISDSGIITSTNKRERIFVYLCRFISVFLIILGLLAFIEGNF
ncbi:MAG: hypothetical protein II842_12715 [Butyrivibrio sp.]|nr:hypothetical protein [Butyrivibrio sp.]